VSRTENKRFAAKFQMRDNCYLQYT